MSASKRAKRSLKKMTLEEKKACIAAFLCRCNEYADGKLAGYRERVTEASGWQALELQDKIGHWTAYRAFNEFTIEELAGSELDEWFVEPENR